MVPQIIVVVLVAAATGQFTVEDAETHAVNNHPALRAAAFAVEEERGQALQDGLPPNPEIEVGVEGWRRNGSDDGGHEFMVGLSQALPISGTRRLARKAGMTGADAAVMNAEALRFEVAGYARALFYESLAAQKRLAIYDEILADAEALAALTRIRVEEGDLPEMDLMRVIAEQHRYKADRERAQKELGGVRARLAELCGMDALELPECVGDIALTAAMLPDAADVEERLLATSGNAARNLRVEQAGTTVDAVRRSALPEPTLYAGLRRDSAAQANSLDLGISLALPLFDRKQGATAAARAREQRLRAENEAAVRENLRTCLALRSEAEAYIIEAEQLRHHVLPQLEQVGTVIGKALEIGGVTLFETLIAKRDIAETRLELLTSESHARAAFTTLEIMMEK